MSSSKKRKLRSFNRGKDNDSKPDGVEDDGRSTLVGCTLAGTLGVDEVEGIEQLLRDSAEKGLKMRQEEQGLVVGSGRSSDMSTLPGWQQDATDERARQSRLEEQGADEGLIRESPISQCRAEGDNPGADIGRVACTEQVEKGREGKTLTSQTLVQPSDRPTFKLSRKEKDDVLEASWRQAFEDCRLNLAKVCRKKGASFGELGKVVAEALKGQEYGFSRCSQATGDLFPLPLPSSLSRTYETPPCVDALVQALNSLYGTKTVLRTREDKTRLARLTGWSVWL